MLKVLIADDEVMDAALIEKSLDWESLGLQIVGIAYDGQQAVDMDEALHPDIIITDLLMPLKNGTEFISEAMKKRENIHVIFISGYKNFEFAHFGIENSIDSYLFKPITLNKLKDAVMSSANACIEEKRRLFEQDSFHVMLDENITKLRHIFLNELITSSDIDDATILRKLSFFKIGLSDKRLCVVVFRLDEPFSPTFSVSQHHLKQFEIGNAINEIIAPIPNINSFTRNDEEHVLIINCSDHISLSWIGFLVNSIIRNILTMCSLSVTAGVGMIADGYANLPVCYKTAVTAAEYRFFTGKGHAIFYHDIVESKKLSPYLMSFPKSEILHSVITGNDLELQRLTDHMLSQLLDEKISPSVVRNLCIELISSCINEINQVNESVVQDVYSNDQIYYTLFSLITLQDIVQYVTRILMHICKDFSKSVYNRHAEIAETICKIIDQHIDHDLSVEMIADEIFLSRGYTSQVFKKITGESISRYIITERMKRAKSFLRNSTLKITDVAKSVGYDNPTYFSSIFKNEVGISPKEFRNRNFSSTATVMEAVD